MFLRRDDLRLSISEFFDAFLCQPECPYGFLRVLIFRIARRRAAVQPTFVHRPGYIRRKKLLPVYVAVERNEISLLVYECLLDRLKVLFLGIALYPASTVLDDDRYDLVFFCVCCHYSPPVLQSDLRYRYVIRQRLVADYFPIDSARSLDRCVMLPGLCDLQTVVSMLRVLMLTDTRARVDPDLFAAVDLLLVLRIDLSNRHVG